MNLPACPYDLPLLPLEENTARGSDGVTLGPFRVNKAKGDFAYRENGDDQRTRRIDAETAGARSVTPRLRVRVKAGRAPDTITGG
jgi:hypothetical protein